MGEGKAKNVIDYLDNLAEKGRVAPGTIVPLKTAFTKVMEAIDKETWGEVDIKNIDVNDYMDRFANLTMGKYGTDSLIVYKSRVNRALGWYKKFLEAPGYAPEIGRRAKSVNPSVKKITKTVIPKQTAPADNTPITKEQPSFMSDVANAPGRVLYPYPLSDGEFIHISLPPKLSRKDANRISSFVQSIAIDEPLRIESGKTQ